MRDGHWSEYTGCNPKTYINCTVLCQKKINLHYVRKLINKIVILFFSCPSSSIPTFVIDWLINGLEFSFRVLTKPYHTKPYKTTQNFRILTKFWNFDLISEFWPIFTILTKFHKYDQISHFLTNFTIVTKFHNFDLIPQCWPNFTILT